jgi:hypothetical protein
MQLLELALLAQISTNIGTGGVTQIVAGANITITPAGGEGVVTVNAVGGGGGSGLAGAGSPQGVATANPGTTYWDTTNKAFWIKDTGVGNTGWLEEIA